MPVVEDSRPANDNFLICRDEISLARTFYVGVNFPDVVYSAQTAFSEFAGTKQRLREKIVTKKYLIFSGYPNSETLS